jgi:hypothetical protein
MNARYPQALILETAFGSAPEVVSRLGGSFQIRAPLKMLALRARVAFHLGALRSGWMNFTIGNFRFSPADEWRAIFRKRLGFRVFRWSLA